METYRAFKVIVAFDRFTTRQVVQLDPDHPRVKYLVGAGYLVPAWAMEVDDGEGEAEPGAGEGDSGGVHDAAGGQDDESD